MSTKIMFIAGEPSGDLHGSNLARALLSLSPECKLFGIGGEQMRAAGVTTFHDIGELSVVGFFDVVRNFSKIKAVFEDALAKLDSEKPGICVLIDYPGFNLQLAKLASRRGVKVIYYVSPQIWAWAPSRIKTIKRYVDKMVVVFEFEKAIYEAAGVPVEFVGHPLLDVVKPTMDKENALRCFGLKGDTLTIGLMPGSRRSEVSRHMPVMLEAAGILRNVYHEGVQFIVSKSSIVAESFYGSRNYKLIEGNVYDLIKVCDLVITSSGTATLETAILGVPMVVIYKVSALSWFLFRPLVKVDHIAMVNIVAKKRIVPELLQGKATAQNIAKEALEILQNREKKEGIKNALSNVREKLGLPGASLRAAKIILNLNLNLDLNLS